MDLNIGRMPHGPRNSIADVSGVRVGHCTVDDERHKTGVTMILPCEDDIFRSKMPAAYHVLNGFGKTTGLMQIGELGTLETPIALTNTLNVGLVHDAMVEYMCRQGERRGYPVYSVNPVVCECNDASLNDIRHRRAGGGLRRHRRRVGGLCPRGRGRGEGHDLPQPEGRHRFLFPACGDRR